MWIDISKVTKQGISKTSNNIVLGKVNGNEFKYQGFKDLCIYLGLEDYNKLNDNLTV